MSEFQFGLDEVSVTVSQEDGELEEDEDYENDSPEIQDGDDEAD